MNNVLIFDYDGVLIDSFDIFIKNYINSCRKYGVYKIKNKKDFLKIFEDNMYVSMKNIGISQDNIIRIIKTLKKTLTRDIKKMPIFNGIYEMVNELSKNNNLVIITSNDTELVKHFLKLNKIEYFDKVYGSNKGKSKVEKINLIKKIYGEKNYFYIGDTTGDIIEGKNAGVKTIAVTWGWHNKDLLETINPDFTVDSPEELLGLFQEKS